MKRRFVYTQGSGWLRRSITYVWFISAKTNHSRRGEREGEATAQSGRKKEKFEATKEPAKQTDIKTIKHLSLYWCMVGLDFKFSVLSSCSLHFVLFYYYFVFIKWKMIRFTPARDNYGLMIIGPILTSTASCTFGCRVHRAETSRR